MVNRAENIPLLAVDFDREGCLGQTRTDGGGYICSGRPAGRVQGPAIWQSDCNVRSIGRGNRG